MSAAELREAAALMRSRAEAATYTAMPWGVDEIGAVWAQEADGQPVPISFRSTDENAEHIASWHPAVALAVADLLDEVAGYREEFDATGGAGHPLPFERRLLAVARAYLASP